MRKFVSFCSIVSSSFLAFSNWSFKNCVVRTDCVVRSRVFSVIKRLTRSAVTFCATMPVLIRERDLKGRDLALTLRKRHHIADLDVAAHLLDDIFHRLAAAVPAIQVVQD